MATIPTLSLLAIASAISVFAMGEALAGGLLDGRSFTGRIGPAGAPDLDDRLTFDGGHFWSDICTRCGFVPGPYLAQSTPEGIAFSGTLESPDRGAFAYDGLVHDDGSIRVDIAWEKARWYWTWRRDIVFEGTMSTEEGPVDLSEIRARMSAMDPDGNALCSRF